MRQPTGCTLAVSFAIALTCTSLGAQAAPAAKAPTPEHVCSLLTKAEAEKYILRGREASSPTGDEMDGVCDYGAAWGQVLVYSGPKAEEQFNRFLKSFKKDQEPRYPLPSLGPDGWVMYPRPDNDYQSIGAFTHARVGQYVVSVFVDADHGKTAETAKAGAEALTRIVMAKLR